MAALPSIPDIITISKISIGLAGIDNARGSLFGKRLNSPYSIVEIAIASDTLSWQYTGDPTDDTLRGYANYVYWMCGKYALAAQYIMTGGGGGTVVPGGLTRPLPLDFIVSATSVFPTGSTGGTIPQYEGWNLDFDRGGLAQNTTNVGDGSSYYSWSRVTYTVAFSPALGEGELVRLTPV